VADLLIDVLRDAPIAHVALSGEFDLAAVPNFDARMRDIESGSLEAIVVDLTAVSFMDSSGLRALISASERAEKARRRFAIVPGPPQVRRVFEITQLVDRLELVENAAAVAAS
jgi:anti-anti-sigma factor